jgi:Peptidase_C39 like family
VKTIKFSAIAKTATLATFAAALSLGLATGPAEAAGGTIYGDPAAAAKWWRHQNYDDCAIMASADVVGQVTGSEPSEDAIIRMAQSTPSVVHPGSIYMRPAKGSATSGMGTSTYDLPELLRQYGIRVVVSDRDDSAKTHVPAGIEGLEQLLASGHKVIVSLNAEMIWHQPIENKDSNGNPRSDHAVVVTGIDTVNNIVHLNDSGIKTGKDEQVPLNLFLKAWETSNERVVTTA